MKKDFERPGKTEVFVYFPSNYYSWMGISEWLWERNLCVSGSWLFDLIKNDRGLPCTFLNKN